MNKINTILKIVELSKKIPAEHFEEFSELIEKRVNEGNGMAQAFMLASLDFVDKTLEENKIEKKIVDYPEHPGTKILNPIPYPTMKDDEDEGVKNVTI
jgi:hypothetical protein